MASQPAGAAAAEAAVSPFLAKPLSPVVKLSSGTFFEGVEKTLEIEFFPKASSSVENNICANDACSLRRVPRERLEEVLGDIGCQILSTISNADCDAYVLSESSLFVFPTLLIIKTCGRTKVLAGLDAFLDIASGLGLRVDQVFYSRKNYLLPDEQAFPHSSLNTEIDFLRSRFPEGDAHIFGPVTGDHWTLFHYEAQHDEGGGDRVDHTLEVLMTGIRREVAAQFFKSPPTPDEDDGEVDDDYGGGDDDGDDGEEAADDSTDADDPRTFGSVTSLFGFDSLFPDMTLDGHLFDPCGYSVNGLSNAGDGTYFTIHVTPEDDFSYASFETNVSIDDYRDLIRAVVSVFEPAQCLVVTYAECHAPGFVFKMHTSLVDSLDEYEARNLHTLDGDGYRVQVCRLLNLS